MQAVVVPDQVADMKLDKSSRVTNSGQAGREFIKATTFGPSSADIQGTAMMTSTSEVRIASGKTSTPGHVFERGQDGGIRLLRLTGNCLIGARCVTLRNQLLINACRRPIPYIDASKVAVAKLEMCDAIIYFSDDSRVKSCTRSYYFIPEGL